jgi:hypothetical protein
MDGKIVHVADDGTQTEVTAGVQALYDLVIGSMDFRSGFWSHEDAVPVGEIARLCGFEKAEEIERYVRQSLHEEESHEWRRAQANRAQAYLNGRNVKHDHVWSSVGRCMWSECHARRSGGLGGEVERDGEGC